MKKNSQEKYLKPIDQFPQNSNGLHYVSKPRSKSTCFGGNMKEYFNKDYVIIVIGHNIIRSYNYKYFCVDLEQIQLLQLSLSSPRRKSKSGNKDRRRNSRSQNKSPENHQFQPTKVFPLKFS